ncbi:histamine H3 receptor-like [Protopterus annectens]|uniref:histamine H3 receptor-like n=1 Tax=Protopterus annectens TaxID=7888 RepID=UPI001CFB64B5|nr:histamine H3 receptor-like [Protopterus annectens]
MLELIQNCSVLADDKECPLETSENGTPKFTSISLLILSFLMTLVVLVTVAGNALIILVFAVDKNLRTSSNLFLLNLAVCDFCVGTVSLPLYIPYVLTGRWTLGRGLCKFWLVIDYLACAASVYTIVVISYDRSLSVTKAVICRVQQNTSCYATSKIASIWIAAFLLYTPSIILWEHVVGRSVVPDEECYPEFFYRWHFLICSCSMDFLMPLLSILYFNIDIYWSIRKRDKNRCKPATQEQSVEDPCKIVAEVLAGSSVDMVNELPNTTLKQSIGRQRYKQKLAMFKDFHSLREVTADMLPLKIGTFVIWHSADMPSDTNVVITTMDNLRMMCESELLNADRFALYIVHLMAE